MCVAFIHPNQGEQGKTKKIYKNSLDCMTIRATLAPLLKLFSVKAQRALMCQLMASLAPRLKLFSVKGPKGPLQELEEST